MNETDHNMHDEGISRIYQQSRIEEPPMGLDSAILTQARNAVETKNTSWRGMRWMFPLTSFALVMLTATLFIQMKQEYPEILEPSSVTSPALQVEERLDDVQSDLRKRKTTVNKEQTEKRDAAGASSPAMEMKSAPAEMEVAPAKNLKMMSKEPLKQEVMGTSPFRSRENLSEADSAAPSQPELLKGQASPDPEAWIVKIRNLLKQKNRDEAIKELETFRLVYPDYTLPDDLKILNK